MQASKKIRRSIRSLVNDKILSEEFSLNSSIIKDLNARLFLSPQKHYEFIVNQEKC